MADNRGVAYMGTGKVEVHDIDFPELELKDGPGVHPENVGRKTPHGAILKVVSTNICGSDQHMVRGRTTAPEGLILGHEITGEVIEAGPRRRVHQGGRPLSVPFNIACGRCRNCKDGDTGVCLNVEPAPRRRLRLRRHGRLDRRPGRVRHGPVRGLEPAASSPTRTQAMEKILDLTMLSDIFPTGYHGCVSAGVGPGSTVYIAGAGPVGLAAAHSAQLLGAAVVIVGDLQPGPAGAGARRSAARPWTSPRASPGSDRADRRRARGRLRGRLPSASRPAATAATRARSSRRPCSTR